jgi:hypothetical protein
MNGMKTRGAAILCLCLTASLAALPQAVAAAAPVSASLAAMTRRPGGAGVVVTMRPVDTEGGETATMRRRRTRQRRVLSAIGAGEFRLRHRFSSVAAFSGRVSERGLEALSRHPDVLRIDADLEGRGALANTVPQIRADRVQARGVTGEGTVIAVLDAGIEADHPDLRDALIHEECFCSELDNGLNVRPSCCPDGASRASGPGSAATQSHHGLHVAGIALSRGAVSSVGVAPGAKLVAVRVVDDETRGVLSDWLAALDWIAAERPDVRVVNMSLTSLRLFIGDCVAGCEVDEICGINRLFAAVIDRLRRRGTLVFVASGNQSQSGALGSPACVPGAVAVGAVDGDDEVASFSNSGLHLDLLAPGVDTISSGLNGGLSLLCDTIGGEQVCGGTSMATPHAAGAAALLFSARPGASATQVEKALRDTGVPIFDRRNGRTFPRIEAFAALRSITSNLELEPGGGSAATDCLLEWNFIPPDIVRRGSRPTAVCRDNDPLCDIDFELGQCTFYFSVCFNVRDPLLRSCDATEVLQSYTVGTPSLTASPGSVERQNAARMEFAIPPFPLDRIDVCTAPVSFVVPRTLESGDGLGHIRMTVRADTRSDYDRFTLRCLAP